LIYYSALNCVSANPKGQSTQKDKKYNPTPIKDGMYLSDPFLTLSILEKNLIDY